MVNESQTNKETIQQEAKGRRSIVRERERMRERKEKTQQTAASDGQSTGIEEKLK